MDVQPSAADLTTTVALFQLLVRFLQNLVLILMFRDLQQNLLMRSFIHGVGDPRPFRTDFLWRLETTLFLLEISSDVAVLTE